MMQVPQDRFHGTVEDAGDLHWLMHNESSLSLLAHMRMSIADYFDEAFTQMEQRTPPNPSRPYTFSMLFDNYAETHIVRMSATLDRALMNARRSGTANPFDFRGLDLGDPPPSDSEAQHSEPSDHQPEDPFNNDFENIWRSTDAEKRPPGSLEYAWLDVQLSSRPGNGTDTMKMITYVPPGEEDGTD